MVDPEYFTNGKVEKAMDLVDSYINKLEIKGLTKQIYRATTGAPMVVYVVEPTEGVTKNVLIYGHLDKQPYGEGWWEDTPPNKPTLKGDLLYGRGGGDDGYAPFSAMLAIKAGQEQGARMPRIALVLETEEESGSPNLLALLNQAKDFIGAPDYMFCMDSGCFDYERIWLTSSLRGICILDLTVEIGAAGYHSGETGGIVPETFRVVRQLIDRLDDAVTGNVCAELKVDPPAWKLEEAKAMAAAAGNSMYSKYAIVEGAQWCNMDDLEKMYLNNTWEPNLSITGADHLPKIQVAGNVVRPKTSVRLSMRLSPTMDPKKAEAIMLEKLTTNVPYNAKVSIHGGHTGSGWCMKSLPDWLNKSIQESGETFYGKPVGSYGMGGSIPFLAELEKMYPQTFIVAFGVLGPNSNAHGPNEMINLTFTKKLTCSLAHIVQSVADN